MKLNGILIAGAALTLMTGTATASFAEHHEGDAKVKCSGINGCSGKGECGAADGSHDCGGKNSCKGKGWVKVESAAACTEKGGTVVEDS